MNLHEIHFGSCGRLQSRGGFIHPDRVIRRDVILYVTSGTLYVSENGTPYALGPGEVLHLEHGKHHYGYRECSSNLSYYWMHYQDEGLETISLRHRKLQSDGILSQLFRQLLHFSNQKNYPRECLDYWVRLILTELMISDTDATVTNRALVYEIREWIRNNSNGTVTTDDIANHFGYNKDYLTRLFKAELKVGLKEYITQSRLQAIKTMLLSSEKSLYEIAIEAGFSEYKYFLDFFKYHEGIGPTAYRNIYYKTRILDK